MKVMKAATLAKKPMKSMRAMKTATAQTTVKKMREKITPPINIKVASFGPFQWSECEMKSMGGSCKVWGNYRVEFHVRASKGHRFGLDRKTKEPTVFAPAESWPFRPPIWLNEAINPIPRR